MQRHCKQNLALAFAGYIWYYMYCHYTSNIKCSQLNKVRWQYSWTWAVMFQQVYAQIISDSITARMTKSLNIQLSYRENIICWTADNSIFGHNKIVLINKNIWQLHKSCSLIFIPLNSVNVWVNCILHDSVFSSLDTILACCHKHHQTSASDRQPDIRMDTQRQHILRFSALA